MLRSARSRCVHPSVPCARRADPPHAQWNMTGSILSVASEDGKVRLFKGTSVPFHLEAQASG